MWDLLPRRHQILIIAGAAILGAFAIEALFRLVEKESLGFFRTISIASMVLGSLGVWFINSSWRTVWSRWPWIGRKTFPDLNGKWEGTLVSTWKAKSDDLPLPPIPTTLLIRQSLFSMSIKLRTKESTSHSTRCLLEADHEAGRFKLWYSYDNQPKAAYTYRSSQHEGVAWLELDIDEDAERLVGLYYTSRKTSGDIDVRRVSPDEQF